ncbi:MAG: hypothetical protein IT429_00220 [Gemmataceae bacterium]|nr:hypothetical protein [Gemmataceae bacterium]
MTAIDELSPLVGRTGTFLKEEAAEKYDSLYGRARVSSTIKSKNAPARLFLAEEVLWSAAADDRPKNERPARETSASRAGRLVASIQREDYSRLPLT